MKKYFNKTILLMLAAASLSQAVTFSFEDFNNTLDETTNTATVDTGSITSITRTTVDTDNTQFAVSVSLGGETLTFNLLVEAFTGGTITDSFPANGPTTGTGGTAIIGLTSTTVSEFSGTAITSGFGTGTGALEIDASLKFTITDLSYTGGGQDAVLNGFDAAFVQEGSGNNHRAVVGVGTGLYERQWQASGEQAVTTNGVTELYISRSRASNSGSFGVSTLNFDITIVPEPSSMTLLALGLSSLLMVRRRSRQA